jgi:hypothetical protein
MPAAPFDTSVAHIARVYNYWLGGKDHFAADRAAGDASMRDFPGIVSSARANRAFLVRAVRFLAAEAGISQFLDIGTGIPSANNTHEVAQGVNPRSRVVYVDNDPIVLTHARALLASHPDGATDYIEADLHHPEQILREAARLLDFSQPVAVMLLAVLLGFGPPRRRLRREVSALAARTHAVRAHYVPCRRHLLVRRASGAYPCCLGEDGDDRGDGLFRIGALCRHGDVLAAGRAQAHDAEHALGVGAAGADGERDR